jgi:hypothetical protein
MKANMATVRKGMRFGSGNSGESQFGAAALKTELLLNKLSITILRGSGGGGWVLTAATVVLTLTVFTVCGGIASANSFATAQRE